MVDCSTASIKVDIFYNNNKIVKIIITIFRRIINYVTAEISVFDETIV